MVKLQGKDYAFIPPVPPVVTISGCTICTQLPAGLGPPEGAYKTLLVPLGVLGIGNHLKRVQAGLASIGSIVAAQAVQTIQGMPSSTS